jgi:hypothetical protein
MNYTLYFTQVTFEVYDPVIDILLSCNRVGVLMYICSDIFGSNTGV